MSLNHPAKDLLIAFGQGKLAADESSQVEQHLEVCRDCCETLLDLKDDTFVGLVKIANVADAASVGIVARTASDSVGRNSKTDAGSVGHGARHDSEHAATVLVQSGEPIGPEELPAELVDHPRYRIVELIGRGGMGNVYRAEHRLMNRPVAIKLINSQLIRQPNAVERFRREVQAAAKLTHPNIVTAYDAEQAGDVHFLVMEFVEGTDLASIVKQRGPMSVAEACDCIRQAAEGLQHAHEKGMVHRDIKPHNLMLASGGQVRILDFGLAGFATEVGQAFQPDSNGQLTSEIESVLERSGQAGKPDLHLTSAGSVMGTPDYMAPEQAKDAHSADIRADIYSLGCTLQFLLTGRPPFEADNIVSKLKAHANDTPQSLTALRKDVPVELSKVAAKMLAKKPSDRFQTPAEVAAALEPFARNTAKRKKEFRRLVAAALLAFLTLMFGVIVVATDRGRLEIQSEVEDVKVVVKKSGTQVEVFDLKTGSQMKWVPGGEIELEVVGNANDVKLDKSGFTMSRLGKVVITAKWNAAGSGVVKAFTTDDKPITQDGVEADDGGWKITAKEARTVRLFEIPSPNLDVGPFFFRAKLRTESVTGRAYLEMWNRFPGIGEAFSKGFHNAVTGTNGWAEYEIPFYLKKGQQPDLIKLNVTIEGTGTVWIKDIELRGRVIGDPIQNQPTKSKAVSPNQFVRDQQAAEWIARIGATQRVNLGGVEKHVAKPDELPDGDWQITEISLYPLRFDTAVKLDKFSGLHELRWMRLFGCQATDDAVKQMTDLPNLKFLDLDQNPAVSDESLKHIAANYPAMESVSLWATGITDEGLRSLSELKKLQILSVAGTKINGSGLAHFAEHPALREIHLGRMKITDEMLRHLPKIPQLDLLSLVHTTLPDDAADAITKLPKLKQLDIRDAEISAASLEKLRSALPNCEILTASTHQEREQFERDTGNFNWVKLEMTKLTATNGPRLRRLDDGSIVAEGVNPAQSIYTINAKTSLKQVTALRLDVLLDDSLPSRGPGRKDDGTFVLTGVEVRFQPAAGAPEKIIPLRRAIADYSQTDHEASSLLKGQGSWAIWRNGATLQNQSLVVELAETLAIKEDSTLTITLKQESPWAGCNLGRFSLSATDNNQASSDSKSAQPAINTEASPLQLFRDLAAVTAYLNNPLNNRGGSVPVALLGQNGRVAFRFGNWLVIFEGIVCDPKIGLLGFSAFNIPHRGSSGEGKIDFGAGDKLPGVLIKYKFADEQNEISINNHRFKLRGKADRLEFDDKAYDATNSFQTILVARDGSTRVAESEAIPKRSPAPNLPAGAMSETVTPGFNGGFEVTKSGLPVSWSFYTQRTVPTGDFDIVMDTTDFKEGEQSLKFVVRKCEPTGGRLSPGFFNEFHIENHNPPGPFETKPGETYKISFWAKNAGSEFVFKARGVSALDGDKGVVIRSKETFNEWRRFECTYTIPPKMWLRLELNVVQPGTFWMDDIQIVRVNDKAAADGSTRKEQEPNYSAQFLKEYNQVVRLGRDQLSDDERKNFFKEFPDREVDWSGEQSRGAMEMFGNLPDSLHNELRKTGYLKWRFADMTVTQQKIFERGFYLFVQRPGFKPELIKTSEVGFAIVPLATSTVVSAFVLYPNDVSEMWSTVVGVREAANDHRAAHLSRLPTLRAKPLTALSPQTGQAEKPGGGPTGVNLIVDPSFENTGLTQLPNGWRAWLNDGPEFRCEVVAGGHTGQHCLRISGKGTRGVVFANDLKADRTKRYALKGWVKIEGDKDARALIKLNYFRGGEFLGVHDLVGATADQPGWHLFEKTDTLDAYPTADHFYAMCHVEGSGTGWFDDLELIAYDRDKLPSDFDARHGRHNRLHGPNSLHRWVGTWETEYVFREHDNSPTETKLSMTTTSERTLGDYFLLSHAKAVPVASKDRKPPLADLPANAAALGGEERLLFLTFDQNLGAFRQWFFSSNGKAFEWRGPWNQAKQTLELRMLPDASNLFSNEHFVDDDHIETKLWFQYVMGQRDAGRWTATRKAVTAKVNVPAVKAPVAEPAELAWLNKHAGEWTIHAKYKPSVWNPQPREETAIEKSEWVLGGRFLMTRSFNEKGELTALWLATYEPLEKSHRAWFFYGNGSSSQWRITWDEASREFHWQATDMPSGWTGTTLNRWINDDTFDNQALIKDEQGRVLLDGTQDKRRKKGNN